jgi:CDP-diacylglycerol--glycerol-3-phosphate 3-phosphatidyltransferase
MAIPFWYIPEYLNVGSTRFYLFALCIFGAVTDILDGYIARRFNQVSEAGRIIDPLADKVAIGVLVFKLFIIGEIPAFYFYLIIGRDLLIFVGGIIVTRIIGKVLPSNVLGKAAVVNIGIVLLLIIIEMDRESLIFMSLYWLSILLIIISFIAYAVRAIEFLKRNEYKSADTGAGN